VPDGDKTMTDRIRLAAFRALARREIGLSIGPSEAESWLTRFPTSLADALDALGDEAARVAAAPRITPMRHSARLDQDEQSIQPRRERSPIVASPKVSSINALPKQASDHTSPIMAGILALVCVWSFLIAAIAAQRALSSGRAWPENAQALGITVLATSVGILYSHIVATESGIASGVWRLSVQLLLPLLGVAAFLAARIAEQRFNALWSETVVHPVPLLIWLALFLFGWASQGKRKKAPAET
jgi:hypothetical protein